MVNPAERSPYEVWRDVARDKGITKPQVIFECVGADGLLQSIVDSCEFLTRIYAAGGWYGNDTVSLTAATHKGATIQYGTLEAVAQGRLDPRPSIGRVIGLDEVPDALDQVRKAQGPPATCKST